MYSNLLTSQKIFHSINACIYWLIMYAIAAAYNNYIFFNDSFLSGGLKAIKYIISILFYFSVVMAVVCHILTITTDPGSLNYDIISQLKMKEKDLCLKCKKDRPLRAHHCSICNKCFMKMDHHCPWVFNCVGFGNQKIFFLFVSYTLLGALFALIMFITFFCSDSFKKIHNASKSRKLDFAQNNMRIFKDSFKEKGDELMIILATVLASLTLVSIISLFFSQIFLISRNITNIEFDSFRNKENTNPYYAETYRLFMFKALMGFKIWKWFFPIVEPNIYNGGYIYDSPFKKVRNS